MTQAYGPTLDFNRLLAADLSLDDGQDLADAQRGFLDTVEFAEVIRPDGHAVWSQRGYAFLDDATPADTVNPSLWRQARLNGIHGLFQVTTYTRPTCTTSRRRPRPSNPSNTWAAWTR